MMNIDNTYIEERSLSEGSFGQVKLMHLKDDANHKYAVKIYSKSKSKDADVRHFRQEMKMLRLDHPNIIKLIGVSESGKLYYDEKAVADVRYSVLELASNGNLFEYIADNAMDEGVVRYYFKQLCMACNILITCKGTPGYMAPEMMNYNGFNYVKNQKCHKLFSSNGYNGEQTDIFALGVILFAMYMGRPPFKMADIDDPFYRMIFCHQIEEFWQPWDTFAEQCGTEISNDFKNLFISMVTFNPIMRLSINEVLSSKWMNKNTPTSSQVNKYMGSIKQKIEEFEMQQRIFIQNIANQKAMQNKPKSEEIKEVCSEENLDNSWLSASSQMKDDEDQIMKDLEEIEKEFGELNDNQIQY